MTTSSARPVRPSVLARAPSLPRQSREDGPDSPIGFDVAVTGLVGWLRAAAPTGERVSLLTAACAYLGGLAVTPVRLPPWLQVRAGDRPAWWRLYRGAGVDVVAVAWGPCQRLGLHDHGGRWSVTAVVTGVICVRPYTLVGEHPDGRCLLVPGRRRLQGPGRIDTDTDGETHHAVANAHADEVAVTLHVFTGLQHACRRYEPAGGGWYRPRVNRPDRGTARSGDPAELPAARHASAATAKESGADGSR